MGKHTPSFPAREVIVGTLGIIYNQGDVDPKEIREAEATPPKLRWEKPSRRNGPPKGNSSIPSLSP